MKTTAALAIVAVSLAACGGGDISEDSPASVDTSALAAADPGGGITMRERVIAQTSRRLDRAPIAVVSD